MNISYSTTIQADNIGKKKHVYTHYFSVIFRLKTLKAHIVTRCFFAPNGKNAFMGVIEAFKRRFLVKNALQNVKSAHFDA